MSLARDIADLGAVTSRLDTVGASSGALSNRNLIINGAMEVAQRGTSQTGVNKYGVDRFITQSSNASIVSAQVSDAPDGFSHSLKLTNGGTDTGTGAYREVKYAVEGYDLAHWQKDTQSLTMSFWVKSSLAGTYQVAFRTDSGTDYWYSFAYTVSANTWTFVTHVIPPSPNSTLSSDNLSGLSIFFVQYYPDNWISGAATTNWETSSATSMATFPQHWANTANATWQLTGCQLELGDKGTDFEHRSYADELQKCKRYFESKSFTTFVEIGYSNGTTSAHCILPYLEKRAAPTVTLPTAGQSTNQLSFRTPTGANPSTTGSNTAYDLTTTQGRIQGGSYAGLTAGGLSTLYLNGTANVTFDSEL